MSMFLPMSAGLKHGCYIIQRPKPSKQRAKKKKENKAEFFYSGKAI